MNPTALSPARRHHVRPLINTGCALTVIGLILALVPSAFPVLPDVFRQYLPVIGPVLIGLGLVAVILGYVLHVNAHDGTCPACGAALQVRPKAQTVTCPKCRKVLTRTGDELYTKE